MQMPEPVADPIIVCEHVTVAYGGDDVLHNVSIRIPRRAFLPFVGPNGAGKTTLLRAILGLIRPRRGRIRTPFAHSPPGYVPQQKAIDPLYPVSARQIVAMGLHPRLGWWRRPTADQRRAVAETLERMDLARHAEKTYAELSGGMRQKVLIARALVGGAEVLVMDEPASELDEASQQETLEHLSRLNQQEGKTILLAHHGLDAVVERADAVVMVDHGHVRVDRLQDLFLRRGTPAEQGSQQNGKGGDTS